MMATNHDNDGFRIDTDCHRSEGHHGSVVAEDWGLKSALFSHTPSQIATVSESSTFIVVMIVTVSCLKKITAIQSQQVVTVAQCCNGLVTQMTAVE